VTNRALWGFFWPHPSDSVSWRRVCRPIAVSASHGNRRSVRDRLIVDSPAGIGWGQVLPNRHHAITQSPDHNWVLLHVERFKTPSSSIEIANMKPMHSIIGNELFAKHLVGQCDNEKQSWFTGNPPYSPVLMRGWAQGTRGCSSIRSAVGCLGRLTIRGNQVRSLRVCAD
jgi:hypothetical protein